MSEWASCCAVGVKVISLLRAKRKCREQCGTAALCVTVHLNSTVALECQNKRFRALLLTKFEHVHWRQMLNIFEVLAVQTINPVTWLQNNSRTTHVHMSCMKIEAHALRLTVLCCLLLGVSNSLGRSEIVFCIAPNHQQRSCQSCACQKERSNKLLSSSGGDAIQFYPSAPQGCCTTLR